MNLARPLLAGFAFVLIAIPLLIAITRAVSTPPHPQLSSSVSTLAAAPVPSDGSSFTRSIALATALTTTLVPLTIASLALALAWPTAWLILALTPRRRSLLTALIALPALLPSTLAFAGWGLLTSPAGPLGPPLAGALESLGLPPGSPAQLAINKAAALASIALALWPLSVALLWPALRATPTSELDALSQAAPGPARRTRVLLKRHRRALITTLAATSLIALGATVPLHLAQVPTLGVLAWAQLALDPAGPRAWAMAWPIVPVILVAAALVARRAPWPEPTTHALHHMVPARALPLPPALLWTITGPAWLLAVVLPLAAAILMAHDRATFALAWKDLAGQSPGTSMSPIAASTLVATLVGAASLALGALALRAGRATSTQPLPPIITSTIAVMALGAALPGVLIGAAIATASSLASPLQGTLIPLVLGHIARFGIIPIIAGLALARLEPPALTDARSQLAGDQLRPWICTSLAPALPALLACALACAALSIHEIEATIQLQPPGYRGVAQLLLDYLHMNSARQLGATVTLIVTLPLLLAAMGAMIIAGPLNRPVQKGRSLP